MVSKKPAKSKKSLKQEKVKEISALLQPALQKFRKEIGEKKFDKKIKKAAKILADGIKAVETKKKKAKPASLKKAVAKKK